MLYQYSGYLTARHVFMLLDRKVLYCAYSKHIHDIDVNKKCFTKLEAFSFILVWCRKFSPVKIPAT